MNKLIKHIAVGITALALIAGPAAASNVASRIGYTSETVMPDKVDTIVIPTLLLASAVFLAVVIVAAEDESESD